MYKSDGAYTLRLRKERRTGVLVMVAFIGLTIVVVMTVTGQLLTRYGATTPIAGMRLESPSLQHPFGTDNFSRDIMDRVIVGARSSVIIGFGTATVSAVIGVFGGVCVVLFRRLDSPIMRIFDGFIAFPPIILAILLVAVAGGGHLQVIIALSVVYAPRVARVTRGLALGVASLPYVEAVRVIGGGRLWAAVHHILPNISGPIAVQTTYIMARAIVVDAGLSFLGLSVPPPTPTWGNMLGEGKLYITEAWWLLVVPGLCISITAICVNLIGDWIRDRTDPISISNG